MKNALFILPLALTVSSLASAQALHQARESSATEQFREADVTLNGLRFHYLEWPNAGAPAMLLIPGTGGGGGCAEGEAPFASAMRDRYHIYAMEQRGQCDSEWAKEYTWQRVIEDIDAFVDAFHLAPVTLVGGSSGAVWGYLYAAQHPEKVARLVAVDGGGRNMPRTRADAQLRSTTVAPNVTFSSPEEAVTYAKTRWHTDPSVDAAVHDWILHGIRKLDDGRWGWRQDPAAVAATQQSMFLPTRDELDAALPNIKCPTLTVRGSEGAVSRELAAQRSQVIPNGGWAEVPNSGHVVHLANPSGFLAVVEKFLAGDSNPKYAKTADNSKAEQEIAQLMRQLEEAHRRGDVAFFDRVYANDFSAITPSGELASRAQVLQAWKSGAVKYDSYEYDDVHVRVYEEAAVVTNRSTRKGHINGRDATGQFRQTRVFVKRNGNWQLVATQVTGVASPATAISKPPESSAHNAETTDDMQQILRLTRERDEAAGRGDGAALAALVDERFSFVSPRGRLLDKKRYVANRTKGTSTMEGFSSRHEDVAVRIYGDAAVVTSRNIATGRAADGDFSGETKETDTWIKSDGKWRLGAIHLSPINYTGAHTADVTRPMVIKASEQLTWVASGNPRGQFEAVLDGSSYQGPYVLRVRRPDGHFDPPHMYETDEELTVLSGTLRIGSGEHPERAKAQAVHAGGHVVIPARTPAYSWAEGETITEAFWAGPAYPKYLGADQDRPMEKPTSSVAQPERSDSVEPRPRSKLEQEINRIREQSRRAFLEGDYDTIDRLWSDDFFSTTSWGAIRTKAEALQGLRKGERKFLSLDYDDIKVRIYGDAAVETGRVTYRSLSGGQEMPGNARYTLVFIKQPAGWRCVAHQVTNIAQAPTASNAAPADAASGKVVEQEVRQVERELTEALLGDDFAAVDRIYADDFTLTNANGLVGDRARRMAMLKSGAVKNLSINQEDVRVRVYGDTAVVTGRATFRVRLGGEEHSEIQRFMHALVKREGRWQMVAQQMTRITEPPILPKANGGTSARRR